MGTSTEQPLGGVGGQGTVFKITRTGKLTKLYTFCSQINCTDGAGSYAGLVQGTDGNFYGTTYYGGEANALGGTVFKITPTGTLTTLYSFCSKTNCTDGSTPAAGLVQGTDGNFYGTTATGGSSTNCSFEGQAGCGTIFKITPTGTLTVLHGVQQKLMRHTDVRTTMRYGDAFTSDMAEAHGKIVGLAL